MRAACVVLGLGDRLAGDDGVGAVVIDALRRDARLPPGVELVEAGSDLLRQAHRLDDRRYIVIVDAVLEPGHCGRVSVSADTHGFDPAQKHAHHLSPAQALELLRTLDTPLARTPCSWVTIGVNHVSMSPELSPEMNRALPGIIDAVLAALVTITSRYPQAD
jgi:hydrogenase maturation protease